MNKKEMTQDKQNKDEFEEEIKKIDDIDMSTEIGEYEEFVKDLNGLTDAEYVPFIKNIVENVSLNAFFDTIKREFNVFCLTDYNFSLHCYYNKNRIEFRGKGENIFSSATAVSALMCYYSLILYQADHLNDDKIKKMCFQNIFGIAKDTFLWNCEEVNKKTLDIIINDISKKGNYARISSSMSYASIAFGWLHEMSHYHLRHQLQNNVEMTIYNEQEADRLAYDVFLSMIEKVKKQDTVFGEFTDCFREYMYLVPVMFLDFEHVSFLIEKILYDKDIDSLNFEWFISRKEKIIDQIEESKVDIDTDEGNDLYKWYIDSVNTFIQILISTEKAGLLDKYKNGGIELEVVKSKLYSEYDNRIDHSYIDGIVDLISIEQNTISQSFVGITVHGTDQPSGYSRKISNIKVNLFEVLKFVAVSALEIGTSGSLGLIMVFVEAISKLFEKTKKLLSENECKVLLIINELTQNGKCCAFENEVIESTLKEYGDLSIDVIHKAISKLSHIDCIDIIDSSISLVEHINSRYDF